MTMLGEFVEVPFYVSNEEIITNEIVNNINKKKSSKETGSLGLETGF
jgi:hypothetical protein